VTYRGLHGRRRTAATGTWPASSFSSFQERNGTGLGPGAGWGDGELRLGVLVAGDATSVAHRGEGRTADLAGVRAPVLRLETQENKGGSGVLTLLRSRGGPKRLAERRRRGRPRRRRRDPGGGRGRSSIRWGGRRVQGRRVLVRTARTSIEDEEEPRTCSPAAGSAGWPVMARRRISLAEARARMERCVSGVEKRKRARQGSASALVGGREGERAPAGEAAAINGHEGLRPSRHSRGRRDGRRNG
jgi:hypothetical protein